MPRRFSLSRLLGFVAILAVAMAAMGSASRFWTAVAATATLAVLLSAILAAWLFDGSRRVYWVGFALFGWTYLVLVSWDWVGVSSVTICRPYSEKWRNQ